MQVFGSSSSDSQQLNRTSNSLPEFGTLGPDLIELILSLLPIPSVIRATSVCKSWNSIIHSGPFKKRISNSNSLPWLFICSQSNFSSTSNPSFAFCPDSEEWIKLPKSTLPFDDSFTALNGLFFTTSPENFCFRPALTNTWHEIAPLGFSTREHLIAAYNDAELSKLTSFIAIGAATGDMPVNIYNPRSGLWETCPPPPQLNVWQNISNTLCLALFQNKLYLLTKHSGFLWSFDLQSRSWSNIVQNLQSPSIEFSYLFTCEDQLVLAGFYRVNFEPEFNLWRIDEKTLEFTRIGAMPVEMHSHFFGHKGQRIYERLQCVGSGNAVYVFSNQRRRWPACICEISSSGKCSWRRIPDLPPGPMSSLRRVVHFCSRVSAQDILGN